MTFPDLLTSIRSLLYLEDEGMVRVAVSAILANRLKAGDPVWTVLIGPSSSGKSQILRPLALTDKKFIHRVDDLTENTLLTGAQGGESLLTQIGSQGIVVISDLTVLFSRNAESRNAILSQLRMVYDGEMRKHVGNQKAPLEWEGYLGILAGSTPSIYQHFEEVADMGERFIYYRMRDYDTRKATHMALQRNIYGSDLDNQLADFYGAYIKEVGLLARDSDDWKQLTEDEQERILDISLFAARLRTPTSYDKYQKAITRIPVSEMPMRVASQLLSLAKGMKAMRLADSGDPTLTEEDLQAVEWCAYSLANEERRRCLEVLSSYDYGEVVPTGVIADTIGLNTTVVGVFLQHLSAVGIVERIGHGNSLKWKIVDIHTRELVRRLAAITKEEAVPDREETLEEFDDTQLQPDF